MGYWTAFLARELARTGSAAASSYAYSRPAPRQTRGRAKKPASDCTPCAAKARIAEGRKFAGLPASVPKRRR